MPFCEDILYKEMLMDERLILGLYNEVIRLAGELDLLFDEIM